jgi:hypothetical protein
MPVAKVGFEVVWMAAWPEAALSMGPPRAGAVVTILPGDKLPADHPVVSTHPEFFK